VKDVERIKVEQMIQEVRRESQEAKKALEESLKESKTYCSSLELISRFSLSKHLLCFFLTLS